MELWAVAVAAAGFVAVKSADEFIWRGCCWMLRHPVRLVACLGRRWGESRVAEELAVAAAAGNACQKAQAELDHIIRFCPREVPDHGIGFPELVSYPGSLVVNDVRGGLLARTGEHRRQLGDLFVLAPLEEGTDCLNPLDFVRPHSPYDMADAKALASLMFREPRPQQNPYWNETAQTLVAGLMLRVLYREARRDRTMASVRETLLQGPEELLDTLEQMVECEHTGMARVGWSMLRKEQKELHYVVSEAVAQTQMWDCEKLRRATAWSDVDLGRLKDGQVRSIYVNLPPGYTETYRPFVRVVLGTALASLKRCRRQRPPHPVIFMLNGCRQFYRSLDLW